MQILSPELPDPSALISDDAILSAYFAACMRSYLNYPDNQKETAYLESNKERLRISSYFEVPRGPPSVLADWGLPENFRGSIHLDEARRGVMEHVLAAPSDRNIALIGDPGVGKTAILFALFEEFMKRGPTGLLTTAGISEYHRRQGMRLFYDDLPENPGLATAIERTGATGIVVSARERDFNCRLSPAQQAMFEKVYLRGFADADIQIVAEKLLHMQGILFDADAKVLLTDYAQGSPIYLWSVVRDLANRDKKRLYAAYLKENASRGIVPYVSRVFQWLLKDGERFRPGGLHTLATLVFLATQMRDRRCHPIHFKHVFDLLNEHTMHAFGESEGACDADLQTHAIEYLSGKGLVCRFPHDCWADALAGEGGNPFSARAERIQQEFETTGIFGSVKLRSLIAGWAEVKGMYQKRPERQRELLLDYVHSALRNYDPKELDDAGMRTDQLVALLTRELGHPLAGLSLSMLAPSQSSVSNYINIQTPVVTDGQVGQGEAGSVEAFETEVTDPEALNAGPAADGPAKPVMSACPTCSNPITIENKILTCKECGKRFCQKCESWVNKVSEHKGRKILTRVPLCEMCYPEETAEKVRAIEDQIRAEDAERARKEDERKAREYAEREEDKARKRAEEERERQALLEKERQRKEDAQRLEEERWLAGVTDTQNVAEKQKALARRLDAPIEVQNRIGMKLRLIPNGEFLMGGGSEGPVHKVKITKPFYLGVYQVTQREWKAVMGENPSHFKGDDLPVERVSWDQCQKFVAALNGKEKTLKYRLPTEVEWEYACRAGSTTKYCFGEDRGHLGEYAWYKANSGVEEYRTVKVGLIFKKSIQEKTILEQNTHQVGQKKPNDLGLYDMHGNVWEWCEDRYGKDYYKNGPENDPKGPSSGSDRVIRGGSWISKAADCASSVRAHNVPHYITDAIGFRLARSF